MFSFVVVFFDVVVVVKINFCCFFVFKLINLIKLVVNEVFNAIITSSRDAIVLGRHLRLPVSLDNIIISSIRSIIEDEPIEQLHHEKM